MENLLGSLKRENKDREKRLNIADKRLLSDMTGYMKTKKICDYDIEQVRRTIIRDTLRSYNRKKNLQVLAGKDYHEYCDKLCENMRRASAGEMIFSRGVTVIFAIALMYAVRLLDVIMGGGNFIKEPVQISLGYLIGTAAILVGTLFIYIYFSQILKGNSDKMTTGQMMGLGLILVLIVAAAYAGVYFLSHIQLFSVLWWIPVLILAAVYVMFRIMYIYHENQLAKEA